MSLTTASRFVRAGGLLILASGFAHGFLGLPGEVLGRIEQGQIQGPAQISMVIGWIYGSVAMLSLGLIVVALSGDLGRGRRAAFRACAVVAVAYLGFGLWALFYRGFHPHFLGFIVPGLLTGVPLLFARSRCSVD